MTKEAYSVHQMPDTAPRPGHPVMNIVPYTPIQSTVPYTALSLWQVVMYDMKSINIVPYGILFLMQRSLPLSLRLAWLRPSNATCIYDKRGLYL